MMSGRVSNQQVFSRQLHKNEYDMDKSKSVWVLVTEGLLKSTMYKVKRLAIRKISSSYMLLHWMPK